MGVTLINVQWKQDLPRVYEWEFEMSCHDYQFHRTRTELSFESPEKAVEWLESVNGGKL